MPFIFIAAAIAGFFMYTNPEYQKIKAEAASYQDIVEANAKASQLRAVRDKLIDERKKIGEADFDKLNKMLPDGVENVRLIIDIDNIAGKYGMKIRNTKVNDISSRSGSVGGSIGPDSTKYGTISLTFSVTASYDDFLLFLRDMEKSQRLVDVTNLTFAASKPAAYDFNVTLQTYWLK
jgi:Tfp pilus assembly protein PilO